MTTIDFSGFIELKKAGHTVIDARQPEIFCDGFIPSSISVTFSESFVSHLHDVMDEEQKVLIVCNEQEVPTLTKALKYSGVSQVVGILPNGFEAWQSSGKKMDMLIAIEADEFVIDFNYDEFFLIDVRSSDEYDTEHIEDAENIPLSEIAPLITDLETDKSYYIYADTVANAITAASIFRQSGFEKVRVVGAAYQDLKKLKLPIHKQKKKQDSSSEFSGN